MTLLLVFAITLFVAVLLSELAERSILSTAVLFLVAGVVASAMSAGSPELHPSHALLSRVAEIALFAVLFTDGMQIGFRDLTRAWRLPGRALLLGMPLGALLTAAIARALFATDWREAFLVAAVLAPTDPVFAAAIVGRREIPYRLRHLLNVESGLNDGIALPFVLAILGTWSLQATPYRDLAVDLIAGLATGVAVAWCANRIERLPMFAVTSRYEPLFVFAIGILVLGITRALGVNEYLGAFAAGITTATVAPERKREFHRFGELLAELFKLAALLVFGSFLSLEMLMNVGVAGFVFGIASIVIARPLSVLAVFVGSPLNRQERLTAAWFGPKGFASVIYAIMILDANVPGAARLFHIIAVAIALSIVAHSSTDVPIAAWYRRCEERRSLAQAS